MDQIVHKCYNPQIDGFYYKKTHSNKCRYCNGMFHVFNFYMKIEDIDALNSKILSEKRFELETVNEFSSFFNITQPLQIVDDATVKYIPTQLDIFYKPIKPASRGLI